MTNIKATDPSNGHVPTGDKCKNTFGRFALDDIMALQIRKWTNCVTMIPIK